VYGRSSRKQQISAAKKKSQHVPVFLPYRQAIIFLHWRAIRIGARI